MGFISEIDDEGRRVSKKYNFEKPNDRRALDLMNAAAAGVMREMSDVILAYGMSDEYRCTTASIYECH